MNPISLVIEHASNQPESIAIAAPNYEMNYANLVGSIRLFAAKLKQFGVSKGHIVGISLRPEFETVVSLALMQLGAISLTSTPSILRNYKNQINFLVTGEIQIGFDPARQLLIDSNFLESLGATPAWLEVADIEDDEVVRLVFSSGTTGTPKGVEFTKSNLLSRTASARSNWMPADPFMSLLGLDTVTGMQTFFWSVFNGKTWLSPTTAEGNYSLLTKYRVEAIKTSPARLDELLSAVAAKPEPLSLKFVEVAGSLLTRRIGEACQRLTGITPLYLYGSTEVGTVTKGFFNPDQPENVGHKVDDVEFEVIEGRVRYRKANMPKNYWLNPKTGNSGFFDGWFYPGDLGNIDEHGNLHLIGRIDDLVNAGGAKFNLLELDTWLKESAIFDDVASFTIINPVGEVEIGLAFVSVKPPIPEILTKRVREFLPDLKVKHIVRLAELPKNKLDKVDRNQLSRLITNR